MSKDENNSDFEINISEMIEMLAFLIDYFTERCCHKIKYKNKFYHFSVEEIN